MASIHRGKRAGPSLAFFALGIAMLTGSSAPSPGKEKPPRVHLALRLETGESIRYRIDTETSIQGNTTSPIVNNEAPKKEDRTTSLEITLAILAAQATPSGGGPAASRLRVSYDLADATSSSDAYDPSADAFAETYKKLQGRSLEFSMSPSGAITNVTGLEDAFANQELARSTKDWLSGFSYASGLPAEGVAVGEKWTRETPAENLPLRGLVWRLESTYLRNESCSPQPSPESADESEEPAAGGPAGPTGKPDECAVILTQSNLVRKGSRGEETPDDYLHNGLRTSGTWTATAEGLDSISLTTGWIVVSTQTVNEQMDYEIKSVQTGSTLHHTGSVKTQTHISMLSPSDNPQGKQP
jgi:hypothetical protein